MVGPPHPGDGAGERAHGRGSAASLGSARLGAPGPDSQDRTVWVQGEGMTNIAE